MAKQKQADETMETAAAEPQEPAAEKAPSYRVLVNPSGQFVKFRMNDPAYDDHLNMQKPPGTRSADWFREPTDAELTAYVAKNPYK